MGRPRKYHTEAERKESNRLRNIKYRAKNHNNTFFVYTHTNANGDVYVGSGNERRPEDFNNSRRSKAWVESFSTDCTVKIIRECDNKQDALFLENNMINSIGLDNLVNKNRATI